MSDKKSEYVGRMAPSPTGALHLGHASTFGVAYERARKFGGSLLLRHEDLDLERCREEYINWIEEDLLWMGFQWDGQAVRQSQRLALYEEVKDVLIQKGLLYESDTSRSGKCDMRSNWKFRVPDGEEIIFNDVNLGTQKYVSGKDFQDFVVWRKDGSPAYELAVVVDDYYMGVTEVVRGEDLLESTARQLLIYKAMGWKAPDFYHCKLVCDRAGKRLSKRYDSLSLRTLREAGIGAQEVMRSNCRVFL